MRLCPFERLKSRPVKARHHIQGRRSHVRSFQSPRALKGRHLSARRRAFIYCCTGHRAAGKTEFVGEAGACLPAGAQGTAPDRCPGTEWLTDIGGVRFLWPDSGRAVAASATWWFAEDDNFVRGWIVKLLAAARSPRPALLTWYVLPLPGLAGGHRSQERPRAPRRPPQSLQRQDRRTACGRAFCRSIAAGR